MSDNGMRELFRAEASDEHIGVSRVDVDGIVARERRTMRRRRAATGAGLLAAASALVIAAPVALGTVGGDTAQGPPVPAGSHPASASRVASPSPSVPDKVVRLDDAAAQVLRDHLQVPAQPGYLTNGPDRGIWTVEAMGDPLVDGKKAITAWVQTGRSDPSFGWPPPSPCPQCIGHRQPDGSVVYIGPEQHEGNNTDYFVEILVSRRDGVTADIGITYHQPKRTLARYPDSVLIAAVTDRRLDLLPHQTPNPSLTQGPR